MLHFHQPVHSLTHATSKYLKYKNLDLFCWLIFCQRRHNRESVWHNEWMTRTAQEAAGSHLKGRPTVCCSLCSSTGTAGVLSLCDRHASEKLLLCRQGESHTHSHHLPVLFPSPYPRASVSRVCGGNEVKLGRKEHALLQKGIGHKSTVARSLEYKPLFSWIPIKKFSRCKYRAHNALLVASSDFIPNFISPTPTLYSPWRTLHGPTCDKRLCALKHAAYLEPPAQLSVTLCAIQLTATWSASHVHIMFPLALSEWKSRTELVGVACVKWAQLHKHYLLEKHKSIESLLWHQRVCASNCYVS